MDSTLLASIRACHWVKSSRSDKRYLVDPLNKKCGCPGYKYRNNCLHLKTWDHKNNTILGIELVSRKYQHLTPMLIEMIFRHAMDDTPKDNRVCCKALTTRGTLCKRVAELPGRYHRRVLENWMQSLWRHYIISVDADRCWEHQSEGYGYQRHYRLKENEVLPFEGNPIGLWNL